MPPSKGDIESGRGCSPSAGDSCIREPTSSVDEVVVPCPAMLLVLVLLRTEKEEEEEEEDSGALRLELQILHGSMSPSLSLSSKSRPSRFSAKERLQPAAARGRLWRGLTLLTIWQVTPVEMALQF